MKDKFLLLLLALFLSIQISGCGTLKGAGQDIESAGEGIQRAAS